MHYTMFVNTVPLVLNIGVYDEERGKPQIIYLDIDLEPMGPKCCTSDNVDDTVNYHELTLFLKKEAEKTTFHLLEKLGTHLINLVGKEERFPIKRLTLTLTKEKVFPEAKSYGVTLTHHYDHE